MSFRKLTFLLAFVGMFIGCQEEAALTKVGEVVTQESVVVNSQPLEVLQHSWLSFGKDGSVSLLDKVGEPMPLQAQYFGENIGAVIQGSQEGYLTLYKKGGAGGKLSIGIFNADFKNLGGETNSDLKLPIRCAGYGGGLWLYGDEEGKLGVTNSTGFHSSISGLEAPNSCIDILSTADDEWVLLGANGELKRINSKTKSNIKVELGVGNYVGMTTVNEGDPGRLGVMTTDGNVQTFNKSTLASLGSFNPVTALNTGDEVAILNSELGIAGTKKGYIFNSSKRGEQYQVFQDKKIIAIAGSVDHKDKVLVVSEDYKLKYVDASGDTTWTVNSSPEKEILFPEGTSSDQKEISGIALSRQGEDNSSSLWVIGLKNSGLMLRYNMDDLTPYATNVVNPALLDGTSVRTAVVGGKNKILIAGDGGKYQMVSTTNGKKLSEVKTIAGFGNVTTSVWSGERYLVGSDTGHIQVILPDGSLDGDKKTVKDIPSIQFMSLGNGKILVGGDRKLVEVNVRGERNSTPTASATSDLIATAADLTEGFWLILTADKKVHKFQVRLETLPLVIPTTPTAMFYSGLEWFVGDESGSVYRFNLSNTAAINLNANKRTYFKDSPIKGFALNGGSPLIFGEGGRVTLLSSQSNPTVYVANGGKDILSATPSTPYMYAGGGCSLGQQKCFGGLECVNASGNLGFPSVCCNKSCNEVCESCNSDKTGKGDGICAPIVNLEVCQAGRCDGNKYYAAATCAGASNQCPQQVEVSCAPYKGCEDQSGCVTSCSSNEQCVEGYVCNNSQCVQLSSGGSRGGSSSEESSKGCSSTDAGASSLVGVLLAMGLIQIGRRRKKC